MYRVSPATQGRTSLLQPIAEVASESVESITCRRRREQILHSIVVIRSQKAILDQHLAALYEVPTKVLLQAVKRNSTRFPADFMFRLSPREFRNLRSQIVTSSSWGGRRTAPYAFTEQGVAMLSSVLRSRRAIAVNIEIIRAFVRLRRMLLQYKELGRRIDALEERTDGQFQVVFDTISSSHHVCRRDAFAVLILTSRSRRRSMPVARSATAHPAGASISIDSRREWSGSPRPR